MRWFYIACDNKSQFVADVRKANRLREEVPGLDRGLGFRILCGRQRSFAPAAAAWKESVNSSTEYAKANAREENREDDHAAFKVASGTRRIARA